MTTDAFIVAARGCYVIALLLVTYLVACAISAGIDWVAEQIREHRRDRR